MCEAQGSDKAPEYVLSGNVRAASIRRVAMPRSNAMWSCDRSSRPYGSAIRCSTVASWRVDVKCTPPFLPDEDRELTDSLDWQGGGPDGE